MRQTNTTYHSANGPGAQPGSKTAGIIFALLLLLGAGFNACQDQPVDSTGISVIRDTIINVRHDTVIVNQTDTVVKTIIDTVIIERHDTVRVNRWDTITRHDTIWDTLTRDTVIRDTVERVVHDTIEVPRLDRPHKAVLSFQARYDTAELNSPTQKVSIDLTEWLQYKVVDSLGMVTGLGVSMSAAIPPQFGYFWVNSLQAGYRFYLRGLALNIPTFRVGLPNGIPDSIPLNRHPYNWIAGLDRGGGLMISAQVEQFTDFLYGWTGQLVERAVGAGGEPYQSRGMLRINRVAPNDRLIFAQISSVIFVTMDVNGKPVVERLEVLFDLELGY